MDKESVCLPPVARTWDGDDSASRVGGDNVLGGNVLQGLLEVTLIAETVSHVSRWDLFLDKKITLKNILDLGSQPVSNYSIKKNKLCKNLNS